MSYWVSLEKDKKIIKVKPFEEGGTYVLGGSDEADLNITYNYGWFYWKCLDKKAGLKWLNGKLAKDCIGKLEKTIKELGTNRYKRDNEYPDYWAPTPGNAGYALNILLKWAKMNPEAKFKVD